MEVEEINPRSEDTPYLKIIISDQGFQKIVNVVSKGIMGEIRDEVEKFEKGMHKDPCPEQPKWGYVVLRDVTDPSKGGIFMIRDRNANPKDSVLQKRKYESQMPGSETVFVCEDLMTTDPIIAKERLEAMYESHVKNKSIEPIKILKDGRG